jgi:hypothetical protein
VLEEMSEDIMIINYQLVYNGPMDVLTRKFVLITLFDYLGHFGEVTRDCWSIVVDD